MENSFSIIIPTCNRKNVAKRAIYSALNQLYVGDFEVIVVDDGSNDGTWEMLEELSKEHPRLKIAKHEGRIQRLAARNTGLKLATKDWICHLDSDDEYLRSYLASANEFINENPDYKVFNGGHIVCRLKRYELRLVHDFKVENEFGEAMDRFRSGCIGMGAFFYRREIHDEIGYFFETGSPYKFADFAKDEFPEMIEWFGPKYMEGGKEIGNPWGEDYYLFYKITRKYKSLPVPMYCYVNYIRRSGFIDQDNDVDLGRLRIHIP